MVRPYIVLAVCVRVLFRQYLCCLCSDFADLKNIFRRWTTTELLCLRRRRRSDRCGDCCRHRGRRNNHRSRIGTGIIHTPDGSCRSRSLAISRRSWRSTTSRLL